MKNYYILFVLIVCLFITGCMGGNTHDVGTLEDFNTTFTDSGFSVNDNTSSYGGEKRITGSMIATLSNGSRIEMVVYDSADSAQLVQDNHIDNFNLLKSTTSVTSKNKGANYYKYVMVANGYYMITSRIDNTLVFSKVLLENRDVVEETIEKFGY